MASGADTDVPRSLAGANSENRTNLTYVFFITYTDYSTLKRIGHILARYSAWVLGLMKLLGIWGVFMIAFADSALLGMPVDFVVATYVYQDRRRLLLYIAMASLGSALGSVPLYIVGYLGGEKVLRKRISEERFLKIHRSFEEHEFWALMFPGMLPPPMPYKIFVLGAAVFEMRFRDFLGKVCQVSGALGARALVRPSNRRTAGRIAEAALAWGFGSDPRRSLPMAALPETRKSGRPIVNNARVGTAAVGRPGRDAFCRGCPRTTLTRLRCGRRICSSIRQGRA